MWGLIIKVSVLLRYAGPLVESPSAAALTGSSVKIKQAASVASQDASSLVNFLSKVDVSPAELLGALSKVQGQSQGSLEGENKNSATTLYYKLHTYFIPRIT